MEVIRYIFCVFNFKFLVVGTMLLGCGMWLVLDSRMLGSFFPALEDSDEGLTGLKISTFLLENFPTEEKQEDPLPNTMIKPLGYICIVFGVLVFFLSFVGYCGALKDSICLLGTYAIFLGFVFVLEIIAGSLFFVYKPIVETEAKAQLVEMLKTKYSARPIPIPDPTLVKQSRILNFKISAVEQTTSNSNELVFNLNSNNYNQQFFTKMKNEMAMEKEQFEITRDGLSSNGGSGADLKTRDDEDGIAEENEGDDNGLLTPKEYAKAQNRFNEVVLFTKIFDATMKNFECCGISNYRDFTAEQLPEYDKIPVACCKFSKDNSSVVEDPECARNPSPRNSWYENGCYEAVIEKVTDYAIVAAVILGVLQVIGIAFALVGGRLVYDSRSSKSVVV